MYHVSFIKYRLFRNVGNSQYIRHHIPDNNKLNNIYSVLILNIPAPPKEKDIRFVIQFSYIAQIHI